MGSEGSVRIAGKGVGWEPGEETYGTAGVGTDAGGIGADEGSGATTGTTGTDGAVGTDTIV